MYRRKFRADVYNEVNEPSKQALIKYLKSEGHEILSTEEDYNADVVSVKDGKTYYHEVERKAQWGEDYLGNRGFTLLPDSRWPSEWEEVRIPGRKQNVETGAKSVNEILRLPAPTNKQLRQRAFIDDLTDRIYRGKRSRQFVGPQEPIISRRITNERLSSQLEKLLEKMGM